MGTTPAALFADARGMGNYYSTLTSSAAAFGYSDTVRFLFESRAEARDVVGVRGVVVQVVRLAAVGGQVEEAAVQAAVGVVGLRGVGAVCLYTKDSTRSGSAAASAVTPPSPP